MAMAMVTSAEKQVVAEAPPFLSYYSDGTVRRGHPLPSIPPSTDPTQNSDPNYIQGVASKDITFDSDLGLWARIFLPQQTQQNPGHGKLLPVVLYFHGGAFLFGEPNWPEFHAFCADMATRSNSIWISVNYRLAPEHRLPAAYEDCLSALRWLKSEADRVSMDPWLAMADFSNCFLCGESAGGNIVHHVALRALDDDPSSWKPLSIRGLVIIHPGFIREDKRQEELEAPQDELVNWKSADILVKIPLPAENPNPNYWNPLLEMSSRKGSLPFPKTLVAHADQDMLFIMGQEYVKALRAIGNHVDEETSHGVGHTFHLFLPHSEQAIALKHKISDFMSLLRN